jgi:hypothetical protein
MRILRMGTVARTNGKRDNNGNAESIRSDDLSAKSAQSECCGVEVVKFGDSDFHGLVSLYNAFASLTAG